MVWHIIQNAKDNTPFRFGGVALNKIANMFNGVNISDTVTIHNDVTWDFGHEAFMLSNGSTINGRARFDIGDVTGEETRIYGLPNQNIDIGPTVVGEQDIYIDSGIMDPSITSGCAPLSRITEGNTDYPSFNFDQTNNESLQFTWSPPANYNGGAVRAKIHWYAFGAGSSGNVVWNFAGTGLRDGDNLIRTFTAGQSVTDAYQGSHVYHITNFTADMTPANNAKNTCIKFRILRDASNSSDTLAGDARLVGVTLRYTLDDATAS